MGDQGRPEKGRRPVRVANCSGYKNDPSHEMFLQATLGDVDFITGDYLAEMNMAENAEAYKAGKVPGYETTAWEAIKESIDVVAAKGIKIIINGGSLNPKGLAKRVAALVKEKHLNLKVAFVEGDDVLSRVGPTVSSLSGTLPEHLDSDNKAITTQTKYGFLKNETPLILARVYLGARAIVKGLQHGADIILCGRVSDASPVIGAACYWHSWSETDYDSLAGSLIAGHLIECSAYVTGGNFSGFTEHPAETFAHPGFPIAEIEADGSCVITKHPGTGGLVTEDTVKCQFLYELQGSMYLNSDVSAYLNGVRVECVGEDRVRVSGIVGKAPPPTTKLAIFYHGGHQCQYILNATGYGTREKWELLERQLRTLVKNRGIMEDFELLEFQVVGVPERNPSSQLLSTSYCRVFAEAVDPKTLLGLLDAFKDISLRHFSGFHFALDMRTALPNPFLAYYPALYAQNNIEESISILGADGTMTLNVPAGHPPTYASLEPRENTPAPTSVPLCNSTPTRSIRLGDIALARSGDKGSNLNFGIFVRSSAAWEWFRAFLSHEKMKELMGSDWDESFFLERVEFPGIWAVHFVVYGILGRGVSSSSRLDNLGKGFADFVRDREVQVPESVLGI
ncbi:hypothetical protein BJ546DRAFT_970711 [Cryomyces antarcticus]